MEREKFYRQNCRQQVMYSRDDMHHVLQAHSQRWQMFHIRLIQMLFNKCVTENFMKIYRMSQKKVFVAFIEGVLL